ncbi:MAG: hypothetical protein IAE78_14415 [Myxococcus sp.]|nr:hypothetical protein [Myxococcus sp.]
MGSARATHRLSTALVSALLASCVLDPSSGLPLGCGKVPITDINAGFTLSDVSWFQDEQTLFVFYRVEAEQGLGAESLIELRYRTDDVVVPWTELSLLTPVHTHLPVDCGVKARCGSLSVKVEKTPREVGLRLRYHRDGALSLEAPVLFNVVGLGPAHLTRSLLVYGVFDETNTQVQWRSRNQFPTVRNEQATELGLRRTFWVTDATFGAVEQPAADNPYGYAFSPICPLDFTSLPWPERRTSERALFEPTALPLTASTSPVVCASATVTDALGTLTTTALARKNPQVRPAFPGLRSPVRENQPVGFVLRVCNRVISQEHLDMQVQRLLLAGEPEICLDDFLATGFSDRLASTFKTRIDQQRQAGKDMVLVLAVHHDDTTRRLGAVIERALESVLLPERDKSSPRVSGAFLLDSSAYRVTSTTLKQLVLWCPSRLITQFDLDVVPAASERDCPAVPDQPDLVLGPFKLNQLPILPTRQQFQTFIDKYSLAQTGSMKKLTYLAPERSALAENIPVGEFGLITKFNNETISAAPEDAFSFCPSEDPAPARTVVQPVGVPGALVPLQQLPALHQQSPFPLYALGLAWESPFLIRAEYETRSAIAATVATFTLPFGIIGTDQRYLGAEQWQRDLFPLADALAQCTRDCDHPTFDSSGVFQPGARFREAFATQCYRPKFPVPNEGGFPRDP